jgi:hypothetical protein
MGLFKGSGSTSSNGGGDSGGGFFGSAIAKLLREKTEGASPKYTYDANSQQYTKMKKGGTASSRADGCAVKGKTKGRFV